jgi:peptidoglycan DL-endopeptidase CwlO
MSINVNQHTPSLFRAPVAEIAQVAARVVEQIVDRVEDMRAQHDARRPEPAMPRVDGAAANDPTMHTVKPGETMESIAAAKGMSADELKRMNPQISSAPLSPGQQIVTSDAQDAPATSGSTSMSTFAPSSTRTSDAPASPVSTELPAESASGPLDLQDVYKRYQGGSYVYGGGRDGSGFGVPGEKNSDCSAFVSAVWKEKGLDLPAHTDGAYNKLKGLGAENTTSSPKPGDVVFWMGAGTGGGISHHMGIYMGDGKVLQQTGSNGGGVQVLPMPKSGIEILRDPRL